MSAPLTHFDAQGQAHMVDVGAKPATAREAVAAGEVRMRPETLALIEAGSVAKGDVLGVARLAAIMGAKRTAEIVPLCHPLPLTGVEVSLTPQAEPARVEIRVTARTVGPTGVEMEAYAGVMAAALALIDMLKAVDKEMTIDRVRLLSKTGGRSGTWHRPEAP